MLNLSYLCLLIRLKKLFLLSDQRLAMALSQHIRTNHRARQKQAHDIKKLAIAYIGHNHRLTNNQWIMAIQWTPSLMLVSQVMLALFKGTMIISCSKLIAQRTSSSTRDRLNNSAISQVSCLSARCLSKTCL